jgi:hypothetical protein
LLVSIADPAPVGTVELPAHGLSKLVDSLVLAFADVDPVEHQQTWDVPIPPWRKPARELAMTREQGKKLWSVLLRHREPPAGLWVFVDNGEADRRALSVALGVCDALHLARAATILWPEEPDRKGRDEDQAPNPGVCDTVRKARFTVV